MTASLSYWLNSVIFGKLHPYILAGKYFKLDSFTKPVTLDPHAHHTKSVIKALKTDQSDQCLSHFKVCQHGQCKVNGKGCLG